MLHNHHSSLHRLALVIITLIIGLTLTVPAARAATLQGFDNSQRELDRRQRLKGAVPVIEDGAPSVAVKMSEDSSPVAFDLTLKAYDADDDILTWSAATPPAHGTARARGTGPSQVINYKPYMDFYGDDSFEVMVDDGNDGFDTILVYVTVTPVNDPPTSADAAVVIDEDTDKTFMVNDFPFYDVDPGDTLHQIQITALPTAGTLYLDANSDGVIDSGEAVTLDQVIAAANLVQLKFKPAPNANGPAYAAFRFLVNDGQANAASDAPMTADVIAVNDAPVNTTPGTQTATQDTDLTGLVFSVADADDDGVIDCLFTLSAANGTFTLPTTDGLVGSGSGASSMTYSGTLAAINTALNGVTYRGNPGYFGPEQFTLISNDLGSTGRGGALTTISMVDAVVMRQNTEPVIENGTPAVTVTMSEGGSPIDFDLTLSAADADDDTLTWSLNTRPEHGMARVRGAGPSQIIGYKPYLDFYGEDSFEVMVDDSFGGLDTILVTVIVTPVNHPPTSADATVTTNENTDYVFDAADFPFSDVDTGDTLQQIQITALPKVGALYLDANSDGVIDSGEAVTLDQVIAAANLVQLKFKPAPNTNGAAYAAFRFLVNDGALNAASDAQMTIDVLAAGGRPDTAKDGIRVDSKSANSKNG